MLESVPYPDFGVKTEAGKYSIPGFGYSSDCKECSREFITSGFVYTPGLWGLCPLHWPELQDTGVRIDDSEWEPAVWRYSNEDKWRILPSDDFTMWVSVVRADRS